MNSNEGTVGASVVIGVRIRMKQPDLDAALIRAAWLEEKRALIGDRACLGRRLEKECYDRVCTRLGGAQ